MEPSNHAQGMYLSGRTDRVQQLAHVSLADGHYNTAVGLQAGQRITERGRLNTVLGANAGRVLSGARNAVAGAMACEKSTNVTDAVVVGAYAGQLMANTTGVVLVGARAGMTLQKASFTTAVGHAAATGMLSGARNVFVGSFAAQYGRDLDDCVFVGDAAGRNARTGRDNVFLGSQAGAATAEVSNSVLVGAHVGEAAATGTDNVMIGSWAASNAAGAEATVVLGAAAAQEATNTARSVWVGYGAGGLASDTWGVTAVGYQAGALAVGATASVFVGAGTGSVGGGNTLLGFGASPQGSWNTVVGAAAGADSALDESVVVGAGVVLGATGSTNVVVGRDLQTSGGQLDRVVLVGSSCSVASARDTVVLGSDNAGGAAAMANVVVVGHGIRAAPGSRLANMVALGMRFPVANVDAESLVVGFNERRVLFANSSTLTIGDNVLRMSGDELSLGTPANRYLFANATTLMAGSGASPVVLAGPDFLQVGYGSAVLQATDTSITLGSGTGLGYFHADLESVKVGYGPGVLYADPFTVYVKDTLGGNVLFANAGILEIGGSQGRSPYFRVQKDNVLVGTESAPVLMANTNTVYLGAGTNEYFYATPSSVRVGTPSAPVLMANTNTVYLGAGENQYFYATPSSVRVGRGDGMFFANTDTVWVRDGAGSNVIHVDKGIMRVGPGAQQYFNCASDGIKVGTGTMGVFTANTSTVYIKNASGGNVFWADTTQVFVKNAAGGNVMFANAAVLELGAGGNRYFQANNTSVQVGTGAGVFKANASTVYLKDGNGGNVLWANAALLAVGTGSSPYLQCNNQSIRVGSVFSANNKAVYVKDTAGSNVLWVDANLVTVSDVMRISDTEMRLGADNNAWMYVRANASPLFTVKASNNQSFIYADTNRFTVSAPGVGNLLSATYGEIRVRSVYGIKITSEQIPGYEAYPTELYVFDKSAIRGYFYNDAPGYIGVGEGSDHTCNIVYQSNGRLTSLEIQGYGNGIKNGNVSTGGGTLRIVGTDNRIGGGTISIGTGSLILNANNFDVRPSGAGSLISWYRNVPPNAIPPGYSDLDGLYVFGNLVVSGQAYKSGGGSWAVSDARLKNSIHVANTAECLDLLKQLPLKKFRYAPSHAQANVPRLGWIAQDVKRHLPHAVQLHATSQLPDAHMLDHEQMHSLAYGALSEVASRSGQHQRDIAALHQGRSQADDNIRRLQADVRQLQAEVRALQARLSV